MAEDEADDDMMEPVDHGHDDFALEFDHDDTDGNTQGDAGKSYPDTVDADVGMDDDDADQTADGMEDDDTDDGDLPPDERVLLDDTEYGAVGDGIEIKAWQLDGLLRDNGKPYPPIYLRRNPPKLTFRRRVSEDDYDDEYSVYLDRTSARMLRDAMINVCNAYDFKPINKKTGRFTWRGFKDSIYDGFMDNPLKFLIKVALGVFFVVILAIALINIRW